MNNKVLSNLSYGVYVVSTCAQDRPTGCIANSVMQVTHDTIAISIHHDNFTNKCIKECKKFAISILGVDVGDNIIPVFGFSSGKDTEKFKGVNFKEIDGLDIIADATGYIICELINQMETETHTIFLGKIIDGDILNNEIPMTYSYYHQVKKGTSPEKAPTFNNNPTPKGNNVAYKCTICGYIYEGDLTKEPDTYLCPICKQPKDKFIKL